MSMVSNIARSRIRAYPRLFYQNSEQGMWISPSDLSTDKVLWRRNLLLNSVWANGTAGTVGSGAVAPTGWAFISTGGSVAYQASADASGKSIAFTASASRPAIAYSYAVSASNTYIASALIETAGGAYSIENLITIASLPTGATITYRKNGATVLNTATATTGDTVSCVIVVAATAGTVSVRFGLGTSSTGTGTVTMSLPQFELGVSRSTYQKMTDFVSEFMNAFPNHTLFQESTGTTPVTAYGQSLGLALDKRLNLSLSPTIITNGSFTSGTTGWTSNAGIATTFESAAHDGKANALHVISPSINGGAVQGAMTANKVYFVSYAIKVISGSAYVGISSNTVGGIHTTADAGTWKTVTRRVYGASDASIRIYANASTTEFWITEIAFYEIQGNHAFQATAGNRLTVEARVNYCLNTEDATAWTKSNGGSGVVPVVTANSGTDPQGGNFADLVVFDKGAGTAATDYSLLIVPGTLNQLASVSYTQSIWLKTSDGTSRSMRCTSPDGQTTTFNVTPSWTLFTFTQAASSSAANRLSLRLSYTGDLGGANNTASLLVFGASSVEGTSAGTYQRVSSATDYADIGAARYINVDGINDGLHTLSMDLSGTDKITLIAAYRNLAATAAAATVIELSTNSSTTAGSFGIIAGADATGVATLSSHQFSINGTALSRKAKVLTGTVVATLTADMALATDELVPRLNGVATGFTTDVATAGTGNFSNAVLYIGNRADTSMYFTGRIYEVILRGSSTTQPKLEQGEKWETQKTLGAY